MEDRSRAVSEAVGAPPTRSGGDLMVLYTVLKATNVGIAAQLNTQPAGDAAPRLQPRCRASNDLSSR